MKHLKLSDEVKIAISVILFTIFVAVIAYIEYNNNLLVKRATTEELVIAGKIKPAFEKE